MIFVITKGKYSWEDVVGVVDAETKARLPLELMAECDYNFIPVELNKVDF